MKTLCRFAVSVAFLTAVSVSEVRAQDCLHGFEGTPAPVLPRWAQGATGHHVFYWCIRADGQVTQHGFSCSYRAPVCSVGALLGMLQTIADSPDPLATAKAKYAENVAFNCSDAMRAEQTDRGALCRERVALFQANKLVWLKGLKIPAAPVPAPVETWAVKTNGTATDRPVRALVNGVLGTMALPKLRATVGQRCDVLKPTFASGSDLWAVYGPDFVPERVAVCAKLATP